MNKVIGVTELQRRFRIVFDEVAKELTPYILMRGSRPEAALIPYDEFVRFQEWQESEILTRFNRLVVRMEAQNRDFSNEEIAADIKAARAEI
jgi:prevent-host-death family protein